MITPEYIRPGDTIGIMAPARWIIQEDLEPFLSLIKEWKLIPVYRESLFVKNSQFAGNDLLRIRELQWMLDDYDIKAIFCARGGYGSIRIIDRLDFRWFEKNPKWLVGYSDITVFHSYLQAHLGIESLHSIMPYSMRDKQETDTLSIKSMRGALFGEKLQYEFDPHSLNRTGTAHGVIIGGNLSVIYALLGTPMALDPMDKILFIEDVDEYLYHIDRMMQSLRLSGCLGKLKGMIVGRMSKMKDNEIPYGLNAQQIIHEIMREYNIPVCFDFPAGHEEPNLALIMGRDVELQVLNQQCTLKFKPSTECKQTMNKE